jgi:hypothetical protein
MSRPSTFSAELFWWRLNRDMPWYSVYLLYWYKSKNTDAASAHPQTGCAECAMFLRGQKQSGEARKGGGSRPGEGGGGLKGEQTLWTSRMSDGLESSSRLLNGFKEAEELLTAALQPPTESDVEEGKVCVRGAGGGAGLYAHYPRALTLMASVKEAVYGGGGGVHARGEGGRRGRAEARRLLEKAVQWSPDYYRALAALGCLLAGIHTHTHTHTHTHNMYIYIYIFQWSPDYYRTQLEETGGRSYTSGAAALQLYVS